MNILTLFVCMNIGMSILGVPGTPFYVNGTENCYFPKTGAPLVNSVVADVPDVLVGNQSATPQNVAGELTEPTNSTNTDPEFQVGGVFNNFFDTVDQAAKSMEVMRNIISGEYIMSVIGHFVVSCSFNETGHLVSGGEHEVWTTLKSGIQTLMFMLATFTLFYWATGRGHILTS